MSEFAEVLPFRQRHTIAIEQPRIAPVIPIDAVVYAEDIVPQTPEQAAFLRKLADLTQEDTSHR